LAVAPPTFAQTVKNKIMILFLYGQDTYRARQKLKEIIEQYKNPASGENLDSAGIKKIHKSGLSLIYLDGENLKFEDFRDIIQQTSMFDEKKLLILSNIFNNQDFKEKFLKNYKDFFKLKPSTRAKLDAGLVPHRNEVSGAGDIILFYEENEISMKDIFFNFLKTKAKTQNFQSLGGEKLKSWIRQELSKLKTEIDSEAIDKLINFVGNDLWQMSNEIKKLVNYRAPRQWSEGGKENEVLFDHKKGGRINVEDIELLVKPKIETAIFKTIDAIAQKNKKQALLLIHQHLEKGDNPLYLLSMINFQFRNLLMIKDLIERHKPYYSILKMTHLHPFVVKKSYQQANKFTLQELKKIYQKIFKADLDIKTGKITPETALDLLLTEI
jgi:DNA polymerase-3 subunit delta